MLHWMNFRCQMLFFCLSLTFSIVVYLRYSFNTSLATSLFFFFFLYSAPMANIIYFQKCNLNEKNTPHSTGAKPKQNRVQHDQSARHNGNKRVIFLSFPHSVLYTTLRTFSPWFLFLKYTLTKRKKINFDRLIRYTSFVTIVTKTRTWWVSVDKSYWRRLPSIAISSSILFAF